MHAGILPAICFAHPRECYFPMQLPTLKVIVFASLLDEKCDISWPSVDYW